MDQTENVADVLRIPSGQIYDSVATGQRRTRQPYRLSAMDKIVPNFGDKGQQINGTAQIKQYLLLENLIDARERRRVVLS
jgi:hypothetical protein